jgi:hypothetical protein
MKNLNSESKITIIVNIQTNYTRDKELEAYEKKLNNLFESLSLKEKR